MTNPYAQAAYKNMNATALTPSEQVARLLEKAASHIARAKAHLEKKEIEARYLATEDAMQIIHGLQNCLSDAPEAASMTAVYNDYYNAMTLLITRINIRNCPKTCDEVMDSLRTMADTWREVDKKLRGQSAASGTNGAIDIAAC